MKKVTDNKHLWKTITPNFTDRILKDEEIVLVEDDKVITAETDLAKILKDHFENIVENLHIECPCKVFCTFFDMCKLYLHSFFYSFLLENT